MSFSITGLYDVQFMIAVATRDGHIFIIKKGNTEPQKLVQLSSLPISVHLVDKNIVVATMNNTLKCFSIQVNWSPSRYCKCLHPLVNL